MGKLKDDILIHYSSQFYDPVKAHEYYLKNRELKEKQAAKTPEQRKREGRQNEAIRFANKGIAAKRTSELNKARTDQTAKLEAIRKNAEESAARIRAKLTAFIEGLQTDTPIPANASPKLKAFLMKQRKLRANGAQKAAQQELQKLGTDLKGAVAKARDDYTKSRQGLVDKFDKAKTTEATNIRKNIQ